MEDNELLRSIHADVREVRNKVDKVGLDLASMRGDYERRFSDIEAHQQHNGPSRWDVGTVITSLGAVLVAWLKPGS